MEPRTGRATLALVDTEDTLHSIAGSNKVIRSISTPSYRPYTSWLAQSNNRAFRFAMTWHLWSYSSVRSAQRAWDWDKLAAITHYIVIAHSATPYKAAVSNIKCTKHNDRPTLQVAGTAYYGKKGANQANFTASTAR